MLDLLNYLINRKSATSNDLFADLNSTCITQPKINKACTDNSCKTCVDLCPSSAISIDSLDENKKDIYINLGQCISCNLCIENCNDEVLVPNFSTKTAVRNINDLNISSSANQENLPFRGVKSNKDLTLFKKSLAIRVVSTGCTACDLEVAACFNPIFYAERFGLSFVASPRMADALLVTGPCGLGMHEAIKNTYEAMPGPKLVIACGTCAISGGLHKDGYYKTNGLSEILPVDVFIPGCPPHPWSIIYGLMLAMNYELVE